MAPGHPGLRAGLGDAARQDGVAHQALALVELAGVHIGLAGVAGGVDQELRAVAAQGGGEQGRGAVVELRPAQVAEGDALPGQQGLISLSDIAGTAEEIDHGSEE